MNALFELYATYLKRRIHFVTSFTAFGEDSIRYDFYAALLRLYNLEPHQLYLEQPIPRSQFVPQQRMQIRGSGRHEDKPEFDLRVDPIAGVLEPGLIVEFGYFRTPEIASNQDKSGKHGKLLNELFRLALLKNYNQFSSYRCLFICVTDSEMIKYGAQGVQGPQAIPIQNNYTLNEVFLNSLNDTARNKIQDKFYLKSLELGIIPTAKRILLMDNPANQFVGQWQLWVWDVNYIQN
jgi:hypothetical protein